MPTRPRRSRLPEDRHPCNFVSSPISPGMSRATSSSCPSAAEPAFDGPLGELDRRAGGELQALVAFGELTGKRYATALAAGGESAAGRLLAIGLGDAPELDRETVVRVAASAERRLGGRTVKRLAIWLSPLVDRAGGRRGRGGRARGARRGRGQLRPAHDLSRRRRDGPAGPRRADPHRAGRRRRERWPRPPSAGSSSARARTSPGRSRTAPPTTSARRSSPTRRGRSPRSTACGSTSSSPSAPPSSGWACSWPSAGAATTRRG